MPCSLLEELKTKYGLLQAESPYANFKVPSLKQTYEFFGFEWDISVSDAWVSEGKEEDQFSDLLDELQREEQVFELTTGVPSLSGLHAYAAVHVCKHVKAAL